MAAQKDDAEIAAAFGELAASLVANESKIVEELIAVQGKPVDIGGYYYPNVAKVDAAMRPSATLNQSLAGLGK